MLINDGGSSSGFYGGNRIKSFDKASEIMREAQLGGEGGLVGRNNLKTEFDKAKAAYKQNPNEKTEDRLEALGFLAVNFDSLDKAKTEQTDGYVSVNDLNTMSKTDWVDPPPSDDTIKIKRPKTSVQNNVKSVDLLSFDFKA